MRRLSEIIMLIEKYEVDAHIDESLLKDIEILFRYSEANEDIRKAIANLDEISMRRLLEILIFRNIDIRSRLQKCKNKLETREHLGDAIVDKKQNSKNSEIEQNNTELDIPILNYNVVAGGAKSARGSFLDLARSLHKQHHGKAIDKIVFTDKYLFNEIGEKGHGGGFDNLKSYLEVVLKDKTVPFELQVPPSGKKDASHSKKRKLETYLKVEFPNIKIVSHTSKVQFHDRFFITKYKNGNAIGLFGPSFNGLNANDVVVMGEIDSKPGSMDRLLRMLEI